MDIAKQSARGSVVLFVGNLAATAVAAVASIVVARLLGPSDFGLFSLSLVAPSLLQLFTHFGTRSAVTKYVAEQVALGEVERARRFAQSAMIFSVLAGAAFAVVNYFASGWMAASLFQRTELQPYIALASVFIFGQSMVLTVIAAATGWYAMGQASFANVLQATLKLAISPALILLGFGVTGAVLGHGLSYMIGGFVSVAILYATKVKLVRERLSYLVEDTKELIRFGFQPFLGNVLSGFSVFYVSVLLAQVASNTVVGYYQVAVNLVAPASLLSGAAASALFPAFASLQATKADTRSAFALSVKYVSYLIGPVLFFLAAASTELMNFFYGGSYVPGSQYLVLLALANTPILIGHSVIPGFLLGIGKPRPALIAVGMAAVILFVAAPLLALSSGLAVTGLILALLVSNASLAGIGLYLVHRNRLGATGWRSALATLAASVVALAACLFLPAIGHPTVMLVVKFVVFAAIYLTLAPPFGAVDGADLDRLAESIREVSFLFVLASPFLSYERFCARLRHRGAQT
jgi:O-antigen/teichoic acid export membrane protein